MHRILNISAKNRSNKNHHFKEKRKGNFLFLFTDHVYSPGKAILLKLDMICGEKNG